MVARYGGDASVLDRRDRLVCSVCGGRQVNIVVTGTERRHLIDADIEKQIEFLSRKTRLGPSTSRMGYPDYTRSPANQTATQPRPREIACSSWASVLLPPRPRHSTSLLGEIGPCVSPSGSRRGVPGSMQQVSVARLPLPRTCDRAQAPSPRSLGAPSMQEP